MDESKDSAAFTALCLAAGPSRAERVRKVLREARETLARCRADELAEPWPDTPPPTWAQERAAVLEAVRGLRELGEALDKHLAEMALQMDELRIMLNRSRDDQGKEEPFELPSLHTN